MTEIRVGELLFPSKAAAEGHFRDILYRYEIGVRIPEPDHRQLAWLLALHPWASTKIGVGIDYFVTRIEQYGYRGIGNRGFAVVRTDGTPTDFSLRKCIYGEKSPPRIVLDAMRQEVQIDVVEAKRRYFEESGDEYGRVECATTKELIKIEDADADHAPPHSFHVLATLFLEARGITPSADMVSPSSDNFMGRTLVDRDLAKAWRVYHKDNAYIRIVKRTAHHGTGPLGTPNPKDKQLKILLEFST
jgi:Protein of unknown function (DUF3223)